MGVPPGLQVRAAILLAVMVKLVLPVHHVGAPAVELGLPLALRLVQRVCGQGAQQEGGVDMGKVEERTWGGA